MTGEAVVRQPPTALPVWWFPVLEGVFFKMTSENWVAPSDSPFWEVRDFEGKTFEELLAERQAQWQLH